MNTLQKLTEKLCEVEEIREDIMELRFGCEFKLDFFTGYENNILINPLRVVIESGEVYYKNLNSILLKNNVIDMTATFLSESSKNKVEDIQISLEKSKIIGNKPQFHHLLWFINERNSKIDCWSTLSIESDGELRYEGNTICKYDNTKDLSDQSEETLEAILTFLTK